MPGPKLYRPYDQPLTDASRKMTREWFLNDQQMTDVIFAAGDVHGPANASADQIALFSDATGKTLKGAVGTGVVHATAGIYSASPVALASEVSGDLPYANLTPSTAASKLLGRGSAAGAGDWQEITLDASLTMTGTTLAAPGAAGGITQLTGDVTAGPGAGSQAATIPNDTVTYAKIQNVSAASKLLGRGSAGGAGDTEEITLGTNLTMTGTTLDASAASGAPTTAQYVTLALDAGLSAERVLTGTTNQIALADGGANGNIVLSTPQNIHTGATPQFARIGLGAAADAAAVGKFSGQYFSPLINDGNTGTALTLDWNAGNEHLCTLTGNVTFTLSNPVDGGRYVILIDTGAGGFTAAWPGTVKWPSGTAPVITATASKLDVIVLIYRAGNTTYYGAFNQNY